MPSPTSDIRSPNISQHAGAGAEDREDLGRLAGLQEALRFLLPRLILITLAVAWLLWQGGVLRLAER